VKSITAASRGIKNPVVYSDVYPAIAGCSFMQIFSAAKCKNRKCTFFVH
jgi:hypothetical protein